MAVYRVNAGLKSPLVSVSPIELLRLYVAGGMISNSEENVFSVHDGLYGH